MEKVSDSLTPVTAQTGLFALLRRWDNGVDRWVQVWNPYQVDKLSPRDLEPVRIEESGIKRKITRYILIAATAFMIWSCLAPLDGGVTMSGNVVVAGYRKTVQSQSGGVVQAIMVHEGDKVKAGQILIRVNPLTADATLASTQSDYITVLVKESRLRAQSSGAATITWSPELARFGNSPEVAAAKSFQLSQFNAARNSLQQQEAALRAQMQGLTAAMSAKKIQLRSLGEELQNTRDLAKQGYVPTSQLNQSERAKADGDAGMASTQSDISKIQASLAELRSTAAKDISTEAADVQKSREAAVTKLQAARFDQDQTEIRAPVSGTIVGLQVFTVGGVVSAGAVLAEVVPAEGKLVVETQVPSKSIDKVKVGGKADLRFSAFNATTTPVIEGTVLTVGVDQLKAKPGEQAKQGEDYYLAQIETTAEGAKKLGALKIQPGMPVDVIVKTGERTFMSYLLKPLTDKFALAFR